MDTATQDDEIRRDIEDSQRLLGSAEPIDVLLEQYKDNAPFLPKIESLRSSYAWIHRSRPDGNCFYRSYIVALFKAFVESGVKAPGCASDSPLQAEYERVLQIVAASKEQLLAAGYPEFTVPDFWEEFYGQLEKLPTFTVNDVFSLFNDYMSSSYIICYLRLLTSLEMLSNDTYSVFIDALNPGMTVQAFCGAENDPMAKEADHLQIMALATWFGIPTAVAYLDASSSTSTATIHKFPEHAVAAAPVVSLLYRPGHYDVLVPLGAL